jgi:hypothetical protein
MSEEERNTREELEVWPKTQPEMGFEYDPCVICRRLTVRPFVASVDRGRGEEHREPLVCNKCLLDMRGDMATELEVRRQLGVLEATVTGYEWRQWILYFAFTILLAALTFIAGLYFCSLGS